MRINCCIVVAIVAAASGCPRIVNGPELTEPGQVYDTCFVPAGHGQGMGLGINSDSDGDLVITPHSISMDIPARYAVVFKCQHGKFVIDGRNGEQLFKRLNKGDDVLIRYCEVLEVRDHSTNAVDLHFIDASPARLPQVESP